MNPPTYIKSNEFIDINQEIVNTYGVPRYKEVNPTLFNIVTFPFLFGIMFGDVGHGFLLLLFTIFVFHQSRNNYGWLSDSVIKARYFLLLMSIFAIYCGLLYNDFFSVSINFASCYVNVCYL